MSWKKQTIKQNQLFTSMFWKYLFNQYRDYLHFLFHTYICKDFHEHPYKVSWSHLSESQLSREIGNLFSTLKSVGSSIQMTLSNQWSFLFLGSITLSVQLCVYNPSLIIWGCHSSENTSLVHICGRKWGKEGRKVWKAGERCSLKKVLLFN